MTLSVFTRAYLLSNPDPRKGVAGARARERERERERERRHSVGEADATADSRCRARGLGNERHALRGEMLEASECEDMTFTMIREVRHQAPLKSGDRALGVPGSSDTEAAVARRDQVGVGRNLRVVESVVERRKVRARARRRHRRRADGVVRRCEGRRQREAREDEREELEYLQ